jgi:putative ABC transport system ATP-binding protein
VTHDPKAAARAQRTLHLEKGQLALDTAAPVPGGRFPVPN